MRSYLAFFVAFTAASLFLLITGDRGLCAPAVHLDEEVVFCMYHKMSDEAMDEQDLEELAFSSGKPIFSLYKPSELFTKRSLGRLRQGLLERTAALDRKTAFKWTFKYTLDRGMLILKSEKSLSRRIALPQPTPTINSDISRKGKTSITKVLRSVVRRNGAFGKDGDLIITLYLKPEKTHTRIQKRKVALMDVTLSLRKIIFQPIKIEVSSPKKPDEALLVYRPRDL